MNVGVGAYRCDQGMPFVLPVVREAENEIIMEEVDHEYSGIAGCPNFVNLALRFVYGEDCVPLREKRIAGVQTLSGTGGLRVFGEVLHQFGHKHIYVPNPTWGNQYVFVLYLPICITFLPRHFNIYSMFPQYPHLHQFGVRGSEISIL